MYAPRPWSSPPTVRSGAAARISSLPMASTTTTNRRASPLFASYTTANRKSSPQIASYSNANPRSLLPTAPPSKHDNGNVSCLKLDRTKSPHTRKSQGPVLSLFPVLRGSRSNTPTLIGMTAQPCRPSCGSNRRISTTATQVPPPSFLPNSDDFTGQPHEFLTEALQHDNTGTEKMCKEEGIIARTVPQRA